MQADLEGTALVRAVQYAEPGGEMITLSQLVGHHGPQLRQLAALELVVPKAQPVGGRCRNRENPPAGEVIGQLEINLRTSTAVSHHRRVPVVHGLCYQPHPQAPPPAPTTLHSLLP